MVVSSLFGGPSTPSAPGGLYQQRPQQPGVTGIIPGITFLPPTDVLPGGGVPGAGYTIVEYKPPEEQPPAPPPPQPPAENGELPDGAGQMQYIELPFIGRIGLIGQLPGGEVGQAQVRLTFPPGILFANALFVPLVPLLPILPAVIIPLSV